MEFQGVKQFQDGSSGCEAHSGWKYYGESLLGHYVKGLFNADDKCPSIFRNVGNNMNVMLPDNWR